MASMRANVERQHDLAQQDAKADPHQQSFHQSLHGAQIPERRRFQPASSGSSWSWKP